MIYECIHDPVNDEEPEVDGRLLGEFMEWYLKLRDDPKELGLK